MRDAKPGEQWMSDLPSARVSWWKLAAVATSAMELSLYASVLEQHPLKWLRG